MKFLTKFIGYNWKFLKWIILFVIGFLTFEFLLIISYNLYMYVNLNLWLQVFNVIIVIAMINKDKPKSRGKRHE